MRAAPLVSRTGRRPRGASGGRRPSRHREEVAQKRLAWLESTVTRRPPGWPLPADPVSPRRAFELLFFDYMGLDSGAAAGGGGDRTTASPGSRTNPCPTLEACCRLGLDTRQVCRAVYEKPVQIFLSRLDPRLRFVRDYSAIRPHAASLPREHRAGGRRGARCARPSQRPGPPRPRATRATARCSSWATACSPGPTTPAVTDGDPSLHGELQAIREAVSRAGAAPTSAAPCWSPPASPAPCAPAWRSGRT